MRIQTQSCETRPASDAITGQGRWTLNRCPSHHPSSHSPAKRAKNRVTFNPKATVNAQPSSQCGDASKLYYSKPELSLFRLEATAILTLSRELPGSPSADGFMIRPDDDDREDTDSLRGLELVMFPKRRLNRLLVQKSLLRYQATLSSRPDVSRRTEQRALAAASAKLSTWSSLVAIETARLDAAQARGASYPIWVDASKPVTVGSPFSHYESRRRRSRRITEDEIGDVARIKRRRME